MSLENQTLIKIKQTYEKDRSRFSIYRRWGHRRDRGGGPRGRHLDALAAAAVGVERVFVESLFLRAQNWFLVLLFLSYVCLSNKARVAVAALLCAWAMMFLLWTVCFVSAQSRGKWLSLLSLVSFTAHEVHMFVWANVWPERNYEDGKTFDQMRRRESSLSKKKGEEKQNHVWGKRLYTTHVTINWLGFLRNDADILRVSYLYLYGSVTWKIWD